MKLLGSIADGGSKWLLYTSAPRFRGFELTAAEGDQVDIRVEAPRGDALTWLLDGRFNVIAKNDDADDSTLDSRIVATLPFNHHQRYYIVLRDYHLESRRFNVKLSMPGRDPIAIPDPLAADWLGYAAANGGRFGWGVSIEDLSAPARAKYREYVGRNFPTATISAYHFATESGETGTAVVGCQEEIGWVDLFGPDGTFVVHGANGDGCGSSSWRWQPTDRDPSTCDCADGGYAACRWCS